MELTRKSSSVFPLLFVTLCQVAAVLKASNNGLRSTNNSWFTPSLQGRQEHEVPLSPHNLSQALPVLSPCLLIQGGQGTIFWHHHKPARSLWWVKRYRYQSLWRCWEIAALVTSAAYFVTAYNKNASDEHGSHPPQKEDTPLPSWNNMGRDVCRKGFRCTDALTIEPVMRSGLPSSETEKRGHTHTPSLPERKGFWWISGGFTSR